MLHLCRVTPVPYGTCHTRGIYQYTRMPCYALIAIPPAPVKLESHEIHLYMYRATCESVSHLGWRANERRGQPVSDLACQSDIASLPQWVFWTPQECLFRILSKLCVSHQLKRQCSFSASRCATRSETREYSEPRKPPCLLHHRVDDNMPLVGSPQRLQRGLRSSQANVPRTTASQQTIASTCTYRRHAHISNRSLQPLATGGCYPFAMRLRCSSLRALRPRRRQLFNSQRPRHGASCQNAPSLRCVASVQHPVLTCSCPSPTKSRPPIPRGCPNTTCPSACSRHQRLPLERMRLHGSASLRGRRRVAGTQMAGTRLLLCFPVHKDLARQMVVDLTRRDRPVASPASAGRGCPAAARRCTAAPCRLAAAACASTCRAG